MAFTNRVRLPIELKKPQFVQERENYRKANGVLVTLSVVIRKVYEGQTDSMPEKLHERLVIALGHDNVSIEGDRYIGGINLDGSYDINWIDFLNKPIAQATFKANVTPFDATNSNCGTCADFNQIIANDDDVGSLDEDSDYTFDVLGNDAACCNPVTLSILTFDSNYLTSATINGSNQIVVHTQATLPELTDVVILTYRAQCDNGQFDEANVIADLNGSIPACNAPTGLNMTNIENDTATLNYTEAVGASGYYIQVRLQSDNSLVYDFNVGAVDHADLSSLVPNTAYRVYIRTDCGGGNYSNFVYIDFTTDNVGSEFCGSYTIENGAGVPLLALYTDCGGNNVRLVVPGFSSREICALQTSPGTPVSIIVPFTGTVNYNGLC